jgi:hypothetical protein
MKVVIPGFCFIFVLLVNCSVFSQDFWEPANGPYGGGVYSIAVNSNNDIFAGSKNGGVFFSNDNGETWVF